MKAKPIIVIVATLVIGFILGMLTSAKIRLHKLEPVRMYFSEDRFREGFYKTIQPDEEQKAKLDEVLDKYSRINSDIQGTFRKQMDESMSNMRREVESNLTKDQIARLRIMDERRKEMIRQHRNNGDSLRPGDRRGYGNRKPYPGDPPPGDHGRRGDKPRIDSL
ncbi:MAG: hypothetical protein MUE32_01070 [Bacteroidales bacterium]|jgi:hypothetical protein|nr:hypothetical protein [Bacteroidales bacterium]